MKPGSRAKVARNAAAAMVVALAVVRVAQGDVGVATGFDYSRGVYGAVEETRILYEPVTVKFKEPRYFLRLTMPYLVINAPAGGQVVAIGPGGQPIRAATGVRETQQGMGDVIAAANYTILQTYRGVFLDLLGKIKFGTADQDKGLGTGENDYSLQLDGTQVFGRYALIETLGYRAYGDPPGIDFNNAVFASLGGVVKHTSHTSSGLIYDFHDNIVPGTAPRRELTLFVTHKATKRSKVQGYTSAGFSDTSLDWAIGAVATFTF